LTGVGGNLLSKDSIDVNKFLKNHPKLVKFIKRYKNLRKNLNSSNIIFIFKSKALENKFVYLLFKNSELKVASFVSPGDSKHKTYFREYYTQKKYPAKKSKKYSNYPMPFAIHLAEGIYIHA
jgi:hypothetical protein